MVRTLAAMAASLALFLTFAVAAQTGIAPPPAFTSPLAPDHPLAGRIWAVHEGRFVTPAEFAARLVDAYIVLFGEVHDNADHHAWQAWILDAVSRQRKARDPNEPPGAVVFEHIRADQQPVLDELAANRAKPKADLTTAEVFELLRWDESGWPSREMFAPIFDRALAWGLPILAGEAPRARMRAAAKSGA